MSVPDLSAVEDLYVDSSLLIAATLAGTHHSRAAAVFFDRLLQSSVRLYFSHLVRYEYLHALERLALGRNLLAPELRERYALDDWDKTLVRQERLRFGMQQLVDFLSVLNEAYELPVDPGLYHRTIETMSLYRLNSYDALHVATAQQVQVSDFATCDRDYERVGTLRVYYITNRSLGLSSAP